MASQNRMMTLTAFLQAQNCSNLPGSWRHPATILDFLSPVTQRLGLGVTYSPTYYEPFHVARLFAAIATGRKDPLSAL